MISSTSTKSLPRSLFGLMFAAAAMGAISEPVLGCDELTSPSMLTTEALVSMSQVGGSRGEQIELSVRDGIIRVVINGEEIPGERLKQEGDCIVVLDKDGQEITQLNLRVVGEPGAFSYVFGEDPKRWEELAARLRDSRGRAVKVQAAKVMLGVHMAEPGAALEKQLKLEPDVTTMISGVYEGLPAHQAGLTEFDIIIAVNGQKPADPDSIRKVLAAAEAEQAVSFDVISAGTPRTVEVKLAKYDGETMRKARLLGTGADSADMAPLQRALVGQGRLLWLGDGNVVERDVLVTPDAQLFRVPRAAPLPPMPPAPPGAVAGAEVQKQLEQVDERLRRLEQLLEKLIAEKQQPR